MNQMSSNAAQQPQSRVVAKVNNDHRGHVSRKPWQPLMILVLGMVALWLTPSVFAQAKGLYYGGLGYEFMFQNYNSAKNLSVTARYWSTQDNDWDIEWSQDWGYQSITGSLGACVFNGLLYCFFTTTDGKL
jgi:hypothetical protein